MSYVTCIYKSNKNRLILALCVLPQLLFLSCLTEQEKINKLDRYFTALHKEGNLNGNVLIAKKGEILYEKCFGIGNIHPIDSLGPNSMFRLASVSKQFTAMGIMILKDQGKLKYDQNVKEFLSGFPYGGITVRQLLQHTSGLPDYVKLMEDKWKPDLPVYDSERLIGGNGDIIEMLFQEMPDVDFAPGEKWKYSNTNYMLLAVIIEKVSGMPFGQFLKKRLFEPAGMDNTTAYPYTCGNDLDMPMRVYGYMTDKKDAKRYTMDCHFLNRAQGDGGIYSTIKDLYKWDQILYTDKLVASETLSEAFSPGTLKNGSFTNYGFGWFIKRSPNGGKVVQHNGGWCGFRTCIYRDMDEEICIIFLLNNSWDGFPYMLKKIQGTIY